MVGARPDWDEDEYDDVSDDVSDDVTDVRGDAGDPWTPAPSAIATPQATASPPASRALGAQAAIIELSFMPRSLARRAANTNLLSSRTTALRRIRQ